MTKTTTTYYRTVLERENIKMTYDSETQEIKIAIERRLKNGVVVSIDHISVHKSYVEPMTTMFKDLLEGAHE